MVELAYFAIAFFVCMPVYALGIILAIRKYPGDKNRQSGCVAVEALVTSANSVIFIAMGNAIEDWHLVNIFCRVLLISAVIFAICLWLMRGKGPPKKKREVERVFRRRKSLLEIFTPRPLVPSRMEVNTWQVHWPMPC
jgi:uncharacterized membrane protein